MLSRVPLIGPFLDMVNPGSRSVSCDMRTPGRPRPREVTTRPRMTDTDLKGYIFISLQVCVLTACVPWIEAVEHGVLLRLSRRNDELYPLPERSGKSVGNVVRNGSRIFDSGAELAPLATAARRRGTALGVLERKSYEGLTDQS